MNNILWFSEFSLESCHEDKLNIEKLYHMNIRGKKFLENGFMEVYSSRFLMGSFVS